MKDVTEHIWRYRLALRQVWNSFVWTDTSLRTWESVYSFQQLKVPLFRTLVADPLGYASDGLFGPAFQVVPNTDVVSILPLLINRDPHTESGVWLPEKVTTLHDAPEMALVDLFDWAPLSYMDLQYLMVLIHGFRVQPERVGHYALVEMAHARVLFIDSETG